MYEFANDNNEFYDYAWNEKNILTKINCTNVKCKFAVYYVNDVNINTYTNLNDDDLEKITHVRVICNANI